MEQQETELEVAGRKIVDLAKALLLADNHFLSSAVGRLKIQPGSYSCPLATDGETLEFTPELICRQFVQTQEAPRHDLLHSVIHCLLLHPFISDDISVPAWDLACDIVAEKNVMEICGPRPGARGEAMVAAIELIQSQVKGSITAEKLYRAFNSGAFVDEFGEWAQTFITDDHSPWHHCQGGEGSSSVSLSEAQSTPDQNEPNPDAEPPSESEASPQTQDEEDPP